MLPSSLSAFPGMALVFCFKAKGSAVQPLTQLMHGGRGSPFQAAAERAHWRQKAPSCTCLDFRRKRSPTIVICKTKHSEHETKLHSPLPQPVTGEFGGCVARVTRLRFKILVIPVDTYLGYSEEVSNDSGKLNIPPPHTHTDKA